jgi:quinol monooxygenase YgiN
VSKIALFVKATTQPGKRDELRRLYEKHLKPHIDADKDEELSFYCYAAENENTICMFELFSESYDLQAAMQSDWFKAYMAEATQILAGPPEVTATIPVWAKGAMI